MTIVTTGQPSTNPRAVKEADALADAGYEVRMIGAQWTGWADEADARLLATRRWDCELVTWHRPNAPWVYWRSGVRHRLARAVAEWKPVRRSALPAAVSRVTPELTARACARPADLFIAHNLGALPAAAAAARRWSSRLGFDAEDFHSGQYPNGDVSKQRRIVEEAERRWIPDCDHLTAASPGIAAAYAPLARVAPSVVRNVFARDHRPARRSTAAGKPLRLYWFSQTIGRDRGLEDVVRAMGRMGVADVELHLRGVWAAGFESELRQLASANGVGPGQIVGYGPADPGELVALAAGYHVGLSPEPGHTRNNDIAQSNKLFTYVLAGLPVIASATSGQAALGRELEGAMWLYPPRDHQALAERIAAVYHDAARLLAAGEAAWAVGDGRLNWDVEQQVLVDAVGRVLPAASGAADHRPARVRRSGEPTRV